MLEVNTVSDRLAHLIDYYESHEQKQIFASDKKRINDNISVFRIYGLGFDRWHFICIEPEREFILVSLFHKSVYLFTCINSNFFETLDCIKQGEKRRGAFSRIISDTNKKEDRSCKKISKKEEGINRLQAVIDAMKRGENIGIVNKIGKKRK